MTAPLEKARFDPAKVLNALAQPLIVVDAQDMAIDANIAAETFFDMGRAALLRSRLSDLLPFGSPVFGLMSDARRNHATVAGYKIDISTPRTGNRGPVDVFIAPAVPAERFRCGNDTGTRNCRKNRQAIDASQRGPLSHRARLHARPRDQEPAVGHPRRGSIA